MKAHLSRAKHSLAALSSWKIVFLPAILLSTSCSGNNQRFAEPGDGWENIVFQFIDAETMAPIPGAYVNPVWVTLTKPGMVNGSQCVRAALLRSDSNGWVRMQGPKGGVIDKVNFMVPGYESFSYRHHYPDAAHVTHIIRAERRDVDQYPAWGAALESLGYQFSGAKEALHWGYYKKFPAKGFNNLADDVIRPQLYFIKRMSLPGNSNLSDFGNMAVCGPEGENIGLEGAAKTISQLQAKIHLNVLCDDKWDTATGRQEFGSLTTALWLASDPMSKASWVEFSKVVPTYPPITGSEASRAFTKTERIAFCAWLQPFAEKVP